MSGTRRESVELRPTCILDEILAAKCLMCLKAGFWETRFDLAVGVPDGCYGSSSCSSSENKLNSSHRGEWGVLWRSNRHGLLRVSQSMQLHGMFCRKQHALPAALSAATACCSSTIVCINIHTPACAARLPMQAGTLICLVPAPLCAVRKFSSQCTCRKRSKQRQRQQAAPAPPAAPAAAAVALRSMKQRGVGL